MANQYYRFTFAFNPVALTTSFQTEGDSGWTAYQEPNYNNGQVRTGGPNNPNNPNGPSGNYLVVGSQDNVFIQLQGPPEGWSMLTSDSQLHVIVSQANSPGSSQGFSPFSGGFVYYPITGAPIGGGIMQFQIPSVIQPGAVPSAGNYNRYELTVAFSVADNSGTAYYFGDDPEMDVQGT